MGPIPQASRIQKLAAFNARYRAVAPKAKGAVAAVLLRPEIVEAWAWILTRAGQDITEKLLNPEELIVTDLGTSVSPDPVQGLVERVGSRLCLPEGFDQSQWQPVATPEFWKSHFDGQPLVNPWVTEDKDDQLFIIQNFPDLARELEIQAKGGRSYGEEFQRRSEVALAGEIKNWSGRNPWVEEFKPGDMSTASIQWQQWRTQEIARLQKQNLPLAKWLQKIAAPLYLNPFESGASWDLTRQMIVSKGDPNFGQLLRRTASWKSSQLDAEALAAEELAIATRRAADEANQNRAAAARRRP